MKKVMLFVVALFVVCAFMSCKKDYTCSCKFSTGAPNIDSPILKATKSDAKDVCDGVETTYKIADPKVECTLK